MQCYGDVMVRDQRSPKNAFSVLDELLTRNDDEDEAEPELIEE